MREVTRFPKILLAGASLALVLAAVPPVLAQESTTASTEAPASTSRATAPDPLSDDELEELVARIALYPDEIVAVIAAASLYPLQVIQAERYLEQVKTDKDLKPDEDWDASVISLLNYPEVVKMMSDDLDWTQAMSDAITYQQDDVLLAIQQLRDKAVADDMIKTDDKITVTQEGDNVEIHPTVAETVYIPQYEPQMLYEPSYPVEPIGYYPEPYDSYYYPTAPYFPGFITGAWWGAAVDWDDGFWGGDWDGGDIDIDCNRCIIDRPDFEGKINTGDIDWRNVDRDKLNFDRNQFNNIDKSKIRNDIKSREGNNLKDRAGDIKAGREARGERAAKINDVRQNHLGAAAAGGAAGLAAGALSQRAGNRDINRQDLANRAGNRPQAGNLPANRDGARAGDRAGNRDGAVAKKEVRSGGKKKPAAKADTRPKKPSALGTPGNGKKTKAYSNRGKQTMGGGQRSKATPHRSSRSVSSGGRSRSMSSGGRSRSMSSGGRRGGGGGGGRGGGGRGGGRR